jgi:hypothetical protein
MKFIPFRTFSGKSTQILVRKALFEGLSPAEYIGQPQPLIPNKNNY